MNAEGVKRVAYDIFTPAEILKIEDRVRTVSENLRAIRELAERSPNGSVRAQLASCDPLLKRLEALSFNAVAAAKASVHKDKLAEDRAAAEEIRPVAQQKSKELLSKSKKKEAT